MGDYKYTPETLAARGMLIPDGPPKYDADGNWIKPPWHNMVAIVDEEAEAMEQDYVETTNASVQMEVNRLAINEEARELHAREKQRRVHAKQRTALRRAVMSGRSPQPGPAALFRTDGAPFIYAGRRNGIFGPSESGKSWLVCLMIAQEIHDDRPVLYLDYENGADEIRKRLHVLGVTDELMDRHLHYYSSEDEECGMTEPLSPALAREIADEIFEDGGRVAVVDAITPVMTRLGLNSDVANDVEQFFQHSLDPLAMAGLAAVALDNTPKTNPFSQLGSQHKRAGNRGASLNIINREPFSENVPGFSDIYVDKDRPGKLSFVKDKENRRYAGQLRFAASSEHVTVDRVEFIAPEDAVDASPITTAEAKANKEAVAVRGAEKMANMVERWIRAQPEGTEWSSSTVMFAAWRATTSPEDRLGTSTDDQKAARVILIVRGILEDQARRNVRVAGLASAPTAPDIVVEALQETP